MYTLWLQRGTLLNCCYASLSLNILQTLLNERSESLMKTRHLVCEERELLQLLRDFLQGEWLASVMVCYCAVSNLIPLFAQEGPAALVSVSSLLPGSTLVM